MKTNFFILIFAVVMMAACGGGSANKSNCQAEGKSCCKESAEKKCSKASAENTGCCKKDSSTNTCTSAGKACSAAKKTINAQVFIKTENVDDFLAATKSLIEKSRAEEGCITYNLYQDPHDKTKFLFFEEWKNQAAIDYHFETEHFKYFGKMLEEFASADPIITIY